MPATRKAPGMSRDGRDHELRLARARGVEERLTAADIRLLERCRLVWVDLDELERTIDFVSGSADTHTLLWLVFYRMLDLSVDEMDRVRLKTSVVACDLLRVTKKKGKAS